MFMSKVSVKDLMTVNRQQDSSDSAGDSNSQNNYSQFPFSQLDDSQDFGSQHSGDSPGRRFYQRYASAAKSQLYTKDANQGKQQTSGGKPNQLQINKARTKEREERDLLQATVSAVKECSADVKSVVGMINETLEDGRVKSEEKLTEHLAQIEAGLTKYNERMLHFLNAKETSEAKIRQLAEEVAEKNGRIEELEKQLADVKKEGFNKLLEDMEDVYKEHHNQLETRVFATTNEQQKVLTKHAQQQEKYMQKLLVNNNNQTADIIGQVKQETLAILDQKIDSELTSQIKNLKMVLAKEVQDEIQILHRGQRRETEDLINRQVEQLRSAGVENHQHLVDRQKLQLQQLQDQHRETMENVINDKVNALNMEQRSQLEAWVENLWRQEKKRTGVHQHEMMKAFKEQVRQYHEHTLEELKHRHMKEMESFVSQHKTNQSRDEDRCGRFYQTRRLPFRSCDSDFEEAGCHSSRPSAVEYAHRPRFRSVSPSGPSSSSSRLRRSFSMEGRGFGDFPLGHSSLSGSPALCNVVDPVMLSPKPYSRTPNLEKLFTQARPLSSSSPGFMSPLGFEAGKLNTKSLFCKANSSPNQDKENEEMTRRRNSSGRSPGRPHLQRKTNRKRKRYAPKKGFAASHKSRKNERKPESSEESSERDETNQSSVKNEDSDNTGKTSDASLDNTGKTSDASLTKKGKERGQKKTARSHIRVSPPMYQVSESKRLLRDETNTMEVTTNQVTAALDPTTQSRPLSMQKCNEDTSNNYHVYQNHQRRPDVFEFNDGPLSPALLQGQRKPGKDERDKRWESAFSIRPTSQIVTRKMYGRYNNGNVSYQQETVMTEVRDTKVGLEAKSRTSSPSMSVTELCFGEQSDTPPEHAYAYEEQWQVNPSSSGFLSYNEPQAQREEIMDQTENRKLRSRKRQDGNFDTTEYSQAGAVKKSKKRKS